MKKNSKVKSLFIISLLMGASIALSSCGGLPTIRPINDNASTEPTEPSEPEEPTEPSEPEEPTEPSEPEEPTEPSEPTEPEVDEEKQQKEALEESIVTTLFNKVNSRAGYDVASAIEIDYMCINLTYIHGNSLQFNGYIDLVGEENQQDVTLGFSLTDEQYAIFRELNLQSYVIDGRLSEKNTLEQLTAVEELVTDSDITFSYAILDGFAWDFGYYNSKHIESLLEQKYTDLFNDYIINELHRTYQIVADFQTIIVENNLRFGLVIRIKNKALVNEKTWTNFGVWIRIVDYNFEELMDLYDDTGVDEEKNLADNYSNEFLLKVFEVINDETSILLGYSFNGNNYL